MTGNAKNLPVNPETLLRMKRIFDFEDDKASTIDQPSTTPEPQGFFSGNNREITVDKDKLARYKAIFD